MNNSTLKDSTTIAIAYSKTSKKVGFNISDPYGRNESYSTNRNGEGIWNSAEKQIVGTTQFSLTGKRSTDRARIVSYFDLKVRD